MLTPEQAESVREQFLEQIEKLPEEQRAELREQIENATAEQLEAFMKQQSSGQEGGGECLFCGIGKGNVETIKVYENNFVVAFLDITPAVPGQTIIIPKEHYQFIFQIPDMILWEMIRIMKMAMPVIVNATKCQGISVYIAQGPAAGQRIGHAAINLIPRFEGDKSAFMWERKEVAKDELEKVAKDIKLGIDKTVSEEKASIEKKVRGETRTAASAAGKIPVPEPERLQEFPRRRA
jgi:histidine triad (HIT) family protein